MRKAIFAMLVFAFSSYCGSSFYLEGSSKGIGVGYEYKYNIFFANIGNDFSYNYQHTKLSTDSNRTRVTNVWGLSLFPNISVGLDLKPNDIISLRPYFGVIQCFSIAYEKFKYVDAWNSKSPGFVFEYYDSYLFRTGFGILINKWKLPVCFSTDVYFFNFSDTYNQISISPRLIIYLKRDR